MKRLDTSPKNPSSGPRTALTARSRYMLAIALTAALSSAGCGPKDETDPGTAGGGTGGSAGEGGTAGAGGSGGDNPCEGLMFNGLASEVVNPGETKTITVNLGDNNPDKIYNDLSIQLKSDKAALIGLTAKTEVNVADDYELVDMRGFRTVAIDPEKHYRLNDDGGCDLNTVTVNSDETIVTSPPGMWLSALRIPEGGGDGVLEDFELTAEGTRTSISELNGEGYLFANTKPAPPESAPAPVNATRDQDGHIVLDLAGWTDEGDGSDLVLGKLGVLATGVTFAAIPNEPGKFRSVDPSNLGSFDLFVTGLGEGYADDTTMVGVNVPEKPEIANLAIDCSSTAGVCVTDWPTPYPVTFTAINATNCVVTPSVISGSGTPGSSSPVILNGNDAISMHSTGSDFLDEIELEAKCNGAGGPSALKTIQFTQE